MNTREENAFEDSVVAQEWIDSIESEEGGSRDLEIYPLLRKWTEERKPGVLLEIGSGQGVCSSKVAIAGTYVGVEPSTLLVERARELYQEDNKEFLGGSVYELPLEDASVDAAFSVGVWFHVADLDRAHLEIARVLKPGGELMILTANPSMDHIWKKWFENPVNEGKMTVGPVLTPGGMLSKNIFYWHGEEEVLGSLKQSGFDVASVTKLGHGKEGYRDEGIWMAVHAVKR